MARFEDAVGFVLAHEGGLVDHPADPGGITNYGISLRYLEKVGLPDGDIDGDGVITETDIIKMTPERAGQFVERDFWKPLGLGSIESQPIATKLLDMAVNLGPRQATKTCQLAVNAVLLDKGMKLKVDGKFGKKTLTALNEFAKDPAPILGSLRWQCWSFYTTLVEKKPNLAPFIRGWRFRAFS